MTYRVAIADDNALSIQGLLANLDFAALDMEVAGTFLNGMELVRFLEHHEVDVIISDIRMPHMTGLELARAVLSTHTGVKIILISAYDDFEYAQEALRIGVYDYVQKPIQYDYLLGVLQKARQEIEDERRLAERLEAARPDMVAKFFADVLHAYPAMAKLTLSEQARFLDLDTERGPYLCVAVIQDASEGKQESLERQMMSVLRLRDELFEAFSKDFTCQMATDRDATLVSLSSPGLSGEELMRRVQRQCEQFDLGRKQRIPALSYGIGKPVDTLWELSYSMDTAIQAINMRFVFQDQNLFLSEKMPARTLMPLHHMLDLEEQVIHCVSVRDREVLRRLVAQLSESFAANAMDRVTTLSYVYVMMSGVLNFFTDRHIDLDAVYRQLFAFGDRVKNATTTEQVCRQLGVLCEMTMDALEDSQRGHQSRMIQRTKEHIQEHLSETQLRLEEIASAVHVNASHLSRLFKRLEGMTITDYITQQRVERAKQLLATSTEAIAGVSESVGYSSPYYFSACFKKLTGETPSEFRKRAQGV